MPHDSERASARLVRLLAAAGPGGCVILPGEAEVAHLDRPDGGRTRVSMSVLLDLERSGIAVRRGGRIRLTDAGEAAFRRLQAKSDVFAAQHREMETVTTPHGERLATNLAESPLGSLSRLKRRDGEPWFPADLIASGERLRADYTRGQFMAPMGARMEPVASRGNAARAGGMADITEAALAARMRVERAIAAVGPETAGLLIDVCCHLKGLEQVERERQWPQRSAKLLLRAGLEMLARHYAPGTAGTPTMRNWGGEGFRPELAVDLKERQRP